MINTDPAVTPDRNKACTMLVKFKSREMNRPTISAYKTAIPAASVAVNAPDIIPPMIITGIIRGPDRFPQRTDQFAETQLIIFFRIVSLDRKVVVGCQQGKTDNQPRNNSAQKQGSHPYIRYSHGIDHHKDARGNNRANDRRCAGDGSAKGCVITCFTHHGNLYRTQRTSVSNRRSGHSAEKHTDHYINVSQAAADVTHQKVSQISAVHPSCCRP